MSRLFINVGRSLMQPLQSSLNSRVNIMGVMVGRNYMKNTAEDTTDAIQANTSSNSKKRKQRYNPKRKAPIRAKINKSLGKEVNLHTPNGLIPYTSFVDNEDIVQKFLTDLASRRQRSLMNCIVVEGKVLIADAIKAGCVPQTILFSRVQDILDLPLPKDVTLYKARYRTLQLWSTLTTSPGIMGIFQKPDLETLEPSPDALPLTIICNNIRDPGNLGSILRNAATVGCDMLIVTKGCVDVWSPKVLRAASGAHFVMPIYADYLWKEIIPLIKEDSNIYIADNATIFNENVNSSSSTHCDSTTNDETGGLMPDTIMQDDENLSPSPFNVKKDKNENRNQDRQTTELKNAEQSIKSVNDSHNRRDLKFREVLDLKAQIPVVPYYMVDFTEKHNTLVIGGETEGLSKELLYHFAEHNTVRINIPMSNGFDSLNTSTATGILAFEIKRQILSKRMSV